MASELVTQLQNSNGDFSCEKYDNLPSSQSAYIAICFTNNYLSEQYALNLKDNLIKFISKLEISFIKGTPPCGGSGIGFGDCQALSMANRIEPFSAINIEPLFQRKITYSALISVDSFPLPA